MAFQTGINDLVLLWSHTVGLSGYCFIKPASGDHCISGAAFGHVSSGEVKVQSLRDLGLGIKVLVARMLGIDWKGGFMQAVAAIWTYQDSLQVGRYRFGAQKEWLHRRHTAPIPSLWRGTDLTTGHLSMS